MKLSSFVPGSDVGRARSSGASTVGSQSGRQFARLVAGSQRDVSRARRPDLSRRHQALPNEGTLSFATGVVGRTVAAVFTTAGVEAGDAEVLVMPTSASERASLAAYTNSPNLDEHFDSAVFLFTDGTRDEVLRQLERGTVRRTPELQQSWRRTGTRH